MDRHGLLGRRKDRDDFRDHSLVQAMTARQATVPLPLSYSGARPHVLDQGNTSHCVGFSGAVVRAVAERRDEARTLEFNGDDLYDLAKQVDGWPGDGTDIRSAARQLLAIGSLVNRSPVASEIGLRRKIAKYARVYTVQEAQQGIVNFGAAWIGSNWYESWFQPIGGVLPTPDTIAGGHAYVLLGWSTTRKAFKAQNSWGLNWGLSGRFWLPYRFVADRADQFGLFNADVDVWTTLDVIGDK